MNIRASHLVETPGTAKKLTHLAYVDGMRGIAAIYVVLHHAYLQFGRPWGFLSHGRHAVVFFIVISGFCMTLQAMRDEGGKETYWQFLGKRATHILPSYYGGLAFSLVMIWLFVGENRGTHWAHSLPVTKEAVWYSVFFLQDFVDGYRDKINHAYWFMPLLVESYLLFPLLLKGLKKVHTVFYVIVCVLAAMLVYNAMVIGVLWARELHLIGLFALGMAAAYVGSNPRMTAQLSQPIFHASAIAAFALYALMIHTIGGPEFITDVLSAITCAFVLAALMHSSGPAKQFLECKPLTWLGALSFALYLIHAPLIEFIDKYVVFFYANDAWSPFEMFTIVGLPFIVAVAWGFHTVVEKPAAMFFRSRSSTRVAKKKTEKQQYIPLAAKRA